MYLAFFAAFTLVWVSGRLFATVVVYFSFALIELNSKRFLSFFILIAFCPRASSRFGTPTEFRTLPRFARWSSTLLAHWPIVELASSINIPQWHLTKARSRRIANKNK